MYVSSLKHYVTYPLSLNATFTTHPSPQILPHHFLLLSLLLFSSLSLQNSRRSPYVKIPVAKLVFPGHFFMCVLIRLTGAVKLLGFNGVTQHGH